MQEEGGKKGSNYGVTDPQIPCHPLAFKPVDLGIIYIQGSVELRGCKVIGRSNDGGVERHGGREAEGKM